VVGGFRETRAAFNVRYGRFAPVITRLDLVAPECTAHRGQKEIHVLMSSRGASGGDGTARPSRSKPRFALPIRSRGGGGPLPSAEDVRGRDRRLEGHTRQQSSAALRGAKAANRKREAKRSKVYVGRTGSAPFKAARQALRRAPSISPSIHFRRRQFYTRVAPRRGARSQWNAEARQGAPATEREAV